MPPFTIVIPHFSARHFVPLRSSSDDQKISQTHPSSNNQTMAGSKSGPKTATNDKCRGKSDSAQDKDTAASGGGPVSGPKMSGLKQRKVADGVNKIKKQRKSKASVAASKDAGEAKSSSNGTGTTGNDHPSNVSNTASLTSVSAAPVPSVRRGKCLLTRQKMSSWIRMCSIMHVHVFLSFECTH